MPRLNATDLQAILRAHPGMPTAELCKRLGGIDRSTLTRRLASLGDAVIRRGGSRRTAYALRRALRGSESSIPLYRIDESGRGHQLGVLDCIQPAGTALSFQEPFLWPLRDAMQDGWFEGLPYPVVDMRPQGFLGRNFARNHAALLRVPENPDDWSDDDVLYVVSSVGYDLPGNLVVGEVAYRQFIEQAKVRVATALTEQEIATVYLERAQLAMAHGDGGSSAAGEFPKFTAFRSMGGLSVDVIVKFSGADDSAAVRRWADLLVCEHLALQALVSSLGIAAAHSRIYRFAGRTFLEVVRFDRHGVSGRSPVCTLHSLNAALLGMAASNWSQVAMRMRREKLVSDETAHTVELLWWFGRLIANSDMHEGNLAFRPDMILTPAYDMLPMFFAPAPGGEVPLREFMPPLPLPAERETWQKAAKAAVEYWQACAGDDRVSAEFRRVCGRCADRVHGAMGQA